jgi:hypothetical protein
MTSETSHRSTTSYKLLTLLTSDEAQWCLHDPNTWKALTSRNHISIIPTRTYQPSLLLVHNIVCVLTIQCVSQSTTVLCGNVVHVFIANNHANFHMNYYNSLFSFMTKSKRKTYIINSWNVIPNLQRKDTRCQIDTNGGIRTCCINSV